jgi:drug/metabolite transporter (DMT)-like permease
MKAPAVNTTLSEAISTSVSPLHRILTRGESISLVVGCTFIGAAAQILMNIGAKKLPQVGVTELLANPLIILRDLPLLGGLSCYGVFTLLLIFALRDGELSVIYPIIALNYVWVAFLSIVFFHESLNPFKACGVFVIVLGVAILGRGRGH